MREHPGLTPARVALIAALVEEKAWLAACREIETLLEVTPSDARVHYLHALAIERSSGGDEASMAERAVARRLGLTPEAEQELLSSFGETTPAPSGGSRNGQAF